MITFLRFIFVIFLIFVPLTFCHIIEFLKHKNIKSTILSHCFDDKKYAILWQKKLQAVGISSSKNNIEAKFSNFTFSSTYSKVGLLVNASCDNWDLIFKKSKNYSFKNPFVWIILTANVTNSLNIIEEYPIDLDSDVTIIDQNGKNNASLYEVYNTGFYNKGKFKIENIGYWNYTNWVLSVNRRMDLSGVVLKSMVVVTHKIVNETFGEYVERSRTTLPDSIHKLKFYTILKYLRDMYNFSYELRRTNSWGYLRNGSLDGMLGQVQRKRIDFAGSPTFLTSVRAKFVDYSSQVWGSKPSFIFRHPKRLGAFFTIFTAPFSSSVWYSILMLLTVACAAITGLLKLKHLEKPGDDKDSAMSSGFLTIWSAVCQQGYTVSRSSISVRLVIFSTFIFTLTIYQYYNASVVSTLLREPPKNIRTLEDLLKSDLKCGIEDILYQTDYLKHTTDPTTLKLYDEKLVTNRKKNFYPAEEGMRMAKQGGFAFHVDPAFGYKLMKETFNEKEICEVQEVQMFRPMIMVAALQKRSPYKEIFTYGIRKTFESGVAQRLRSIWDAPKPNCIRTPDTSLFSVTIVEFATPLLILLAGTCMAGAILAAEIVVFHYTRYRKFRGTKIIEFRH